MAIKRVSDLVVGPIADELLRLYQLDSNWTV